MAFDREAAKQAGYTDAEIDAYLREERTKKAAPRAPVAEESTTPPDSTTVVPDAGGGAAAVATSAGLAAAPYVVPAAAGAAGAYGANKLYGAWKQSAQAAQSLADAKMASEQGIAQRAAARAVPVPSGPVAPVAPSSILDASGRPMAASVRAPVAPTMAPPTAMPAAQPGLLDKTTAMIRQLAANKVLQGASRVGGAASAAMYSPELGPAVPRSGRMRGMEINPVTGRPWTPEQIQQYEANPSIYDAQLGAPQFQR
jgi:hypothetical protein